MSTVDRRIDLRTEGRRGVLPWRRHQVNSEVAPLLATYLERHPKGETSRIERAFELARNAHQDQVRRSGDPYISHPLSVARILAGLGLDDVTIAGALNLVKTLVVVGLVSAAEFGVFSIAVLALLLVIAVKSVAIADRYVQQAEA
ncbi:MAG: HD domain-containing protein, partial [Acidimicrobiia bacterium]